jgi:hypothetical protein
MDMRLHFISSTQIPSPSVYTPSARPLTVTLNLPVAAVIESAVSFA